MGTKQSKINKTKKSNLKKKDQTKHYERKILQRPLSLFCVICLLLGLRPPLRVFGVPRETPLEKTSFSFRSAYPLELASGLGMEGCDHVPSHCWDPIWPRLCRPGACCHSLCEFRRPAVAGRLFSWCSLFLTLLLVNHNSDFSLYLQNCLQFYSSHSWDLMTGWHRKWFLWSTSKSWKYLNIKHLIINWSVNCPCGNFCRKSDKGEMTLKIPFSKWK